MVKVLSTKEIIDLQWAIERTLEEHAATVSFQEDYRLAPITVAGFTFHMPQRIQAMAYPDLVRLLIRDGYEPLLQNFSKEEYFREFLRDCGFHVIEGVDESGRSWPVISHIGVKSTEGVK